MNLSDVFKFTQGLGQNGHQIGRKVGDAIELLTLGMINLDENLMPFLVIEDGVEGATTARHKVEFSFYNLDDNLNPTKEPNDLFGLIECKKVGVEVTVKQNFKKWKSKVANKVSFHLSHGYEFGIAPRNIDRKWKIKITGELNGENNLKINVRKFGKNKEIDNNDIVYNVNENDQILIALTVNYELFVLNPRENLSQILDSLSKCVILSIKKIDTNNIKEIKVDDSLPGPQTPEKAKQASFVSLDVRKKVLGRFDKTDDKSFISILVIGESAHWEEKSRSMVRLCNDHNLTIPDEILVYLFSKFLKEFGDNYQERITKTSYRDDEDVRELISQIIEHFDSKILQDMETENFVEFKHAIENETNRVIIQEIESSLKL